MNKIILIIILCCALTLRFFNLSSNPPSLNWDEASLGYTAWTLLNYGTDEYGNAWPFSIRSFNDYKPPLYSYLTIIPVALFGLTEFSTRFTSALLGSLTILILYLLSKELLPKNHQLLNSHPRLKAAIPLLSALLLAISPWHLQFSRGAFEGNIAVFFVTTGLYLLLKWLNTQKAYFLIFSATSLIASLYAYHAARLVVPLVGILILIRFYKRFLTHWKVTLICALLTAITLTPLVVISLRGSVAARAGAVSIFNQKYLPQNIIQREIEEKQHGNYLLSLIFDSRVQYLPLIIKGYLNHYSVYHMFIAGDVVNRHHAPDMGLLYIVELPFILIGLAVLAVQKFPGKFLFWSWWLIAPLPAALSSGTPHAIRSILWLPLPQIATAIGIITLLIFTLNFMKIKIHQKISITIVSLIFISLFTVNFCYYLIQYYIHQPVEYARDWQYGYKQMISTIKDIYPEFPQVLVTTGNDQPYIFFLFYEQYSLSEGVNPGDFNRYFRNIEFKAIDYLKERQRQNILIVGAGDEVPPGEPIPVTEIPYPDGTIAYRIFKRPGNQ